MNPYKSMSGSKAEDLFIALFCDVFGAESTGYLYTQYPFSDIYENILFADFALENNARRIVFEIDDEASHSAKIVSRQKFYKDILKHNSMTFLGWDVYRFAVKQLQEQQETIKDELRYFLGNHPLFKTIDDYLPKQKGKAFEYKEHQAAALAALTEMRRNNETIALLYHATGTGKTVTAVSDAKSVGGRVLFVAHTKELVEQAYKTFRSLWPEVETGLYYDVIKQPSAHVVCGSIQSIALNLEFFKEDQFDYLIVDEAHHATAETYRKVLAYFRPQFTLGLTATPERMDEKSILEIFQNVAHRLDIRTAVELGELVSVRCIRIHTNIDITRVRINGARYNTRELEDKVFIPERNQKIVETYLEFVKNKRTVVFCVSVKHAEEIAESFRNSGVSAAAVSGGMKTSDRRETLAKFEKGEIFVLCACDLLNEGWDCPQTEVLFMARPTMSKLLYTQQLGRGMRTAPNKDHLMVFDFIDIAGQYNTPFSLHRLTRLDTYKPGKLVFGRRRQVENEDELYAKGEKPDVIIDYPIEIMDYEAVDVFNWQEEAAGMISQMEFVRMVDVQSETIEEYVKQGKIVPDMEVPMSEKRVFKYFHEETVQKYAAQFGWALIDDDNRKALFMDMVTRMDMLYSYKPLLLLAILQYADEKGKVKVADIVSYFKEFYNLRKLAGKIVEKKTSIFAKPDFTEKEAERNILANPFKRFEQMQMMRHSKTIGIIEVESSVWKKLILAEKEEIKAICEKKLEEYYKKIKEAEE